MVCIDRFQEPVHYNNRMHAQPNDGRKSHRARAVPLVFQQGYELLLKPAPRLVKSFRINPSHPTV